MMLKTAVFGLCLLLLVAPSFQYGTVLVDSVLPVKNDAVHFSSARTDTAVFNEFDVGSLSLSNPDGFVATPPGVVEFAGSVVDVNGELGVSFGTPGADTTINAGGVFTGLTQDLNINAANHFSVATGDDLTVQSGRSVSVTAQVMDLEGLFGFVVQSRLGNVDVSSGVEIFSFSDALSINAVDTLSIDSVNEIDFTSAGHDMEFNAKRMNMLAVEELELISEQDLTVTAEDHIFSYSGSSELTSLGNLNFNSNSRNVDFTAADTTRVSGESVSLDADSFVYLTATEYSQGRVSLWAENSLNINSNTAVFFASNNVLVRSEDGHTISTSTASFNAESELHFGTALTESIDISSDRLLTFSVTDDVGEEFDVIANENLEFTAADVFNVDASLDVLLNVAQAAFDASSISVSAGSLAQIGALGRQDSDVVVLADTNISATAADDIAFESNRFLVGAGSLAWSSTGDHTEVFALKYLATADTASYSATGDAIISGANFLIDASDDVTLTASDVLFSADRGDISAFFRSEITVTQEGSLTMSTSNDFHIIVATDDDDDVGSITFNPVNLDAAGLMTISAVESAEIISYLVDIFIGSTGLGSVRFVNSNADGEGESRFNAVDDIQFTGIRGLPAVAIVTADEVLFDAGGDLQIFTADLTITATESVEFITNSDGGALLIFEGDTTTLSSTNSTALQADGSLFFDFAVNTFDTPSLTIASTDRSSYSAVDAIEIAGSFLEDLVEPENFYGTVTVDSANGLAFASPDDFVVTSLAHGAQPGNIGFVSASNIVRTVDGDITTTSFGDFTVDGGAITHSSGGAMTSSFLGSLTYAADEDGAVLSLHASQGDIVLDAASLDLDADTWLSRSTNLVVDSGDESISFDAPEITFRGRTLDVSAGGDYTVNADVIVIDADNTDGTSTTTTVDTSALAEDTVIFTSEGDITFDSTDLGGPGITATTIDLRILGQQSVHIEADSGVLSVLALNEADDRITFNSGGHTAFLAESGNADILSEDLVSIKAGRSFQMQSFLEDGIDVTAELGDFVVRAGGASVYFEGSDFFNITADNPTTDTDTADINFVAAHGISVETEIGGLLFEAFSPVPTSPTDNILITSAGDHGDIVFDSTRSNIVTEAPLEVTFVSTDGSIDSQTFGQTAFSSQSDMSFTAGAGEFDVNGYRGIQVTAGSDGFPSDLTWTSGGQFDTGANGVIDIRSVGPIAAGDVALAIETQDGGIRFVTSNAGDIRLTARNDQTFAGDNFLVTPATNDFYAETVGGSIDTFAFLSGNFSTQGGPIEMITTTGTLGGAITLDAIADDITFTAGGAGTFSAEETIALQAQTGISLLSHDGRLTIAAEASTSNINMIASNEISLVSVGTRYSDPNDGISFDAANNIEFGTIDTSRITFNSVNLFQIGEHTRPLVDINAGGSSTQDGFVIHSIGGIFTQSNRTMELVVGDDFEVTAENSVTGMSGGPMLFTSEQDVLLRSLLGVLRLDGDNLDMQASTSIEGTTSGIFSVGSTGRLPSHGVSLQAPLVEFSAGGGMEWISHVVNGDVDDGFTITSTGDSIWKAFSESGSDTSISFDANNGLTFQSRDSLELRSRDRDGAITFSTQDSTNGDLFITTQVGSDIEFNAGNEMGVHSAGPVDITSSNSKITFDANDTDPADDGSLGDIEILATGDITATATRNTLWTGEASVTIQTTSTEGDVGGAMSFSSTGEMSITSQLDATIENTLNEGGSITFTSQSDLEVQTFDDEGSIMFASDLDTTFNAARDLIYTTIDDGFLANVGEDVAMVANGIHPSNDYGVFIESEAAPIEFRALFGGLVFAGQQGAEIQTTADFLANVDTSASMVGTTGASIRSEEISLAAQEARVDFKGSQGFEFVTTAGSEFLAAGVDDSSSYGVAFSSAGRLEVDTGADFDSEAVEGLYISGASVDISAVNEVDITAERGNLLFDATDYVSFFANGGIDVQAEENLVLRSGGYLFVDSDEAIEIESGGSLLLQATGTDAGVKGFAAGALDFDASTLAVYSAETPGADVNITTTLGEMIIDTDTTVITASSGNFVFNLPADDGDFYVDVGSIDIDVSGSVAFTSNLFTPTVNVLGMAIDLDDDLVISSQNDVSFTAAEDIDISASEDIDFDANNGEGLGGDVVIQAEGTDVLVSGNTLSISTIKEGSSMTFATGARDIRMTASTVVLDSVMKLPYRPYPGTNRNNLLTCRLGEVWITNFSHIRLQTQGGDPVEPSVNLVADHSMLCVCENFAYFSTTSGSAATRPVCVPFNEPQCDLYLDPFCPLFSDYYTSIPSN